MEPQSGRRLTLRLYFVGKQKFPLSEVDAKLVPLEYLVLYPLDVPVQPLGAGPVRDPYASAVVAVAKTMSVATPRVENALEMFMTIPNLTWWGMLSE